MVAAPFKFRPIRYVEAVVLGIGGVASMGLAGWLYSQYRLDPLATQRQQACLFWGVTSTDELNMCYQSAEQQATIVEPLRRHIIDLEIKEFNQDLASPASGRKEDACTAPAPPLYVASMSRAARPAALIAHASACALPRRSDLLLRLTHP